MINYNSSTNISCYFCFQKLDTFFWFWYENRVSWSNYWQSSASTQKNQNASKNCHDYSTYFNFNHWMLRNVLLVPTYDWDKMQKSICFLSNLFKISEFLCDTGSTEVKPGFPHEDDCTIEYVTCSLTKPSEIVPRAGIFCVFLFHFIH